MHNFSPFSINIHTYRQFGGCKGLVGKICIILGLFSLTFIRIYDCWGGELNDTPAPPHNIKGAQPLEGPPLPNLCSILLKDFTQRIIYVIRKTRHRNQFAWIWYKNLLWNCSWIMDSYMELFRRRFLTCKVLLVLSGAGCLHNTVKE